MKRWNDSRADEKTFDYWDENAYRPSAGRYADTGRYDAIVEEAIELREIDKLGREASREPDYELWQEGS